MPKIESGMTVLVTPLGVEAVVNYFYGPADQLRAKLTGPEGVRIDTVVTNLKAPDGLVSASEVWHALGGQVRLNGVSEAELRVALASAREGLEELYNITGMEHRPGMSRN